MTQAGAITAGIIDDTGVPKVTDPAALPLRTVRHVTDSLATLRQELAVGRVATLRHCSCCAKTAGRQHYRRLAA